MARKTLTLIIGIASLALATDVVAGGFGGFGRALRRNLQRSAKNRVQQTKDNAVNRVTNAKDETVTNLTGGVVTSSGGEIADVDLKQSLTDKVKERATAITPLAGANNSTEAKDMLTSSARSRIEEMRARLTPSALSDQVVNDATGGQISTSDTGEATLSIRERIRARLDDAKANAQGKVNSQVEGTVGVIDQVGGTSGDLDLASATAEDFAAIDGIEQEDGDKLVAYRDQHGSLAVEDLATVVGYKKYLLLRTHLGGGDDEEEAEQ